MRKDPKEFRERFLRWKAGALVYDNGRPIESMNEEFERRKLIDGLPAYGDGKGSGKINWSRWDDAELTSYPVPFINEKRITLTNAGRATGAVLSTNLLDSIADNADRAGLPLLDALGLAVKESTLGNPTDDRTACNLSSGIRQAFNNKYPGTELHINYWGDALNERDDVINYHKGHQSDDPNSKGKSVLQEAFEFYGLHSDKYNPGQPGYLTAVNKRGEEVMQSPEVKRWKTARDVRKKLEKSMWNRLNPLLKPSKFNLPKYRDGKESEIYYIDNINPVYLDLQTGDVWQKGKPKGGFMLPELVVKGKNLKAKEAALNTVHEQPLEAPMIDPLALLIGGGKYSGDLISDALSEVIGKGINKISKPLFNAFDKSITLKNAHKISDKVWDQQYNLAVLSGNLLEALRLRDLHFIAKAPNTKVKTTEGMPLKTYHTVNEAYPADFYEFNPNIEGTHSAVYTSDSPIMSGTYTNRLISEDEKDYYIHAGLENMKHSLKEGYVSGSVAKDYENALKNAEAGKKYVLDHMPQLKLPILSERQKLLYIKLDNPVTINGMGHHWNNIPIIDLPESVYKALKSSGMNGYTTRDIEKALKLVGLYDGAVITDITDFGGSWKSAMAKMKPSTVYLINSPNNLKLSDAITYDNAGNIIPISKRDNFNIADIRYGLIPALGIGSGYTLYKNTQNELRNK